MNNMIEILWYEYAVVWFKFDYEITFESAVNNEIASFSLEFVPHECIFWTIFFLFSINE